MSDTNTTDVTPTRDLLFDEEIRAVFSGAQVALSERRWAATLRAQELLYSVRGRLTYKTQFTELARLFGECAFQKGDYAAALVWLQQGDPNGLLLADALYALGKFKEAALKYRAAADTAKSM